MAHEIKRSSFEAMSSSIEIKAESGSVQAASLKTSEKLRGNFKVIISASLEVTKH